MATSDYVRALMTVAEQENNIEQIGTQLRSFLKVMEECPDLKMALSHPLISREQKHSLLETICSGYGFSRLLVNFLWLVVSHNRIKNLPRIHAEYETRMLEHQGLVRVEVTSATNLDSSQRRKLTEKLKSLLKKEVILEVKTDESLLAGFRLKFQDTVFDVSLKGKLERL